MVKHEDARVERRDLVDEAEPVDDEAGVEAVQVGGELVSVRVRVRVRVRVQVCGELARRIGRSVGTSLGRSVGESHDLLADASCAC